MKQHAFSLIELLCASLISLIVLTSMISAFLSYRDNFLLQKSLIDIQENARFASHFLREDIQLAGFASCAPSINEVVSLRVYQGENNTWMPNLPSDPRLKPEENTDVITVQHLSAQTVPLLTMVDNKITVPLKPIFNQGDTIMITDCQRHVLSQVQSVSVSLKCQHQTLTLNKELTKPFGQMAEVGKWQHDFFFIQKVRNTYALYLLNNRKTELIDDIRNMKINGYILSSNSLIKKAPSQITDWHQVVALQITLSLSLNKKFKFVIPLQKKLGDRLLF